VICGGHWLTQPSPGEFLDVATCLKKSCGEAVLLKTNMHNKIIPGHHIRKQKYFRGSVNKEAIKYLLLNS
jgi:hypothetical protein